LTSGTHDKLQGSVSHISNRAGDYPYVSEARDMVMNTKLWEENQELRADLAKAKERVAEMQYEAGIYQALYENAADEIERLRAKLEIARKALEFYAKDYDYDLGCSIWDGGVVARATLTSALGKSDG
jgi:predicted nuclease with TOPRIM domain